MARLTTAGARISYERHPRRAAGPGGRCFGTAVLVHGWACDASDWEPLLDRFAPLGDVVTLDLRGSGRSVATAADDDGAYTVTALAADVGELLERLRLERAVLVGHSAGAEVAVATAALRPGRVRAVVAVDPAYGFPRDSRAAIARVARRLDEDAFGVAAEYFARLEDTRRTPRELADRHQASVLRSSPEVLRRTFREFAFGAGAFHFRPDTDAFLRPLPVPLLGVYRNESRAAVGRALAVRPGDRVLTYAPAGHWPHQEQPDRFVSDVADWLRELEL